MANLHDNLETNMAAVNRTSIVNSSATMTKTLIYILTMLTKQ